VLFECCIFPLDKFSYACTSFVTLQSDNSLPKIIRGNNLAGLVGKTLPV